jgi:hypothetical protein
VSLEDLARLVEGLGWAGVGVPATDAGARAGTTTRAGSPALTGSGGNRV